MPDERAIVPQSSVTYSVAPWCNSLGKRMCDILAAVVLLVVLLPWIVLIAAGVRLTSRGSVFFRQRRPGKNGSEFVILKFRTMVVSERDPGPALTWTADPRVAGFGRFLRKWKLDEFPQLWNVLRGDMSFVGPRPLPSALWNNCPIHEEAGYVLSVRPGITGRAALDFRSEEDMLVPLASLPAAEAEAEYIRHIMPLKLRIELEYLRTASFVGDCRIVFNTVLRVLNRQDESRTSAIRQSLPFLAQNGRMAPQNPKKEPVAAEPGD